mmetsp:Transcript_105635/g.128920  ORF Transcript_105635/g.128920 Transcript_105635/m.128920 type:complete len:240 (-) Transcript_105635:36-755(-)
MDHCGSSALSSSGQPTFSTHDPSPSWSCHTLLARRRPELGRAALGMGPMVPNQKPPGAPGSEEVGLLHDAKEFFFIDLAISIAVRFIDHLLKFFIGHALPEFFRHALQVLEADLPSFIVVEEPEGLQDFIFGIAVQDLVGHHLQELLITNGAGAIIIHIRDHLLNFLLLWLETQGPHGHLQLLGVDLATAIGVEQIEGLLNLLLLLIRELLLLLPTCVEAAKSHDARQTTQSGDSREYA